MSKEVGIYQSFIPMAKINSFSQSSLILCRRKTITFQQHPEAIYICLPDGSHLSQAAALYKKKKNEGPGPLDNDLCNFLQLDSLK